MMMSKEERRKKDREQKYKKYHSDPEYREKTLKADRERQYKKYNSDPEWREKKRKRNRERYINDPEFREKKTAISRKETRERSYKNKTKAIEYTGGKCCHNDSCHWNGDYKLSQIDFHHVISENKTKHFSALFRSYKWKRIKEEIDNCKAIPLCAMCHRDMTYEGKL